MDRNKASAIAVLWDLDGVLADTAEIHYQSWVVALTEVGIPFDRQKFQHIFGMNNARGLSILLGHPPGPSLLARISDRKESLFRQMIRGRVHPMPGVRTWLEKLQAMGYSQAVASSAPQANIDALVDEMLIRPYFKTLVSSYDMPSKPDPAVFLEAARLLGVNPQRCIVVEDAVAGVIAAHRAGMKCIALTTSHQRSELAEAEVIISGPEELKEEDFRI